MSATPTTTPQQSGARRSSLDRDVAASLAVTEYARVAELLESLTEEQWRAPTECPGWDVRAMAGHMLGMIQMLASLREVTAQPLRAAWTAKRHGGPLIDALTGLQVDKNAGLTTDALIDEVRRLAPQATRNRRRAPGLIRNRALQDDYDGRWTFAYLFDVILTRDPFMHRIDISRACGAELVLAPDHEGVIVADVAREWAGRHGQPHLLELTGPAGGQFGEAQGGEGEGGEQITIDAVEFCRVLSGRAPGVGLLATRIPF